MIKSPTHPRTRIARSVRRQAGFTVFEVLIASTLALVLMFGAIYQIGESYDVVREGDRRVHTNVHARRILDRFLKDCRYASSLDVTGNLQNGWTINLTTLNSLSPGDLVYSWDPNTEVFALTDDANNSSNLIEGLQTFTLETQVVSGQNGVEISWIGVQWTVDVDAGIEAGIDPEERTLGLGGSTWVRKNAPSF